MKIAFSFFLLIYSRCGAPASWAARHTIVCLDIGYTETLCHDEAIVLTAAVIRLLLLGMHAV